MTASHPAQLFAQAMQQHQSGNLAAAEQLYRQVLGLVPNHPDSLHMLGVLAMQTNKLDLALDLIDRSIRLAPRQTGYLVNRASALTRLNRIDDAILAYQQALALEPGLVEANFNLGNLFRSRGQLPAAAACYGAAANARPNMPELWIAFAIALEGLGDFAPAADAWQRVCELQPDDPDALNNRGNNLQHLNRIDDAIDCYQRALAIRPDYPEGHNNLANAYLRTERLDQAIAELQLAIAQRPDYSEAQRVLGNALKRADRLEESLAAHERSVSLQPGSPQALSDLGSALHDAGRFDDAIDRFRSAIRFNPNFPDAHFNLGLTLLLRGQFDEGWAEHEWRWQVARYATAKLSLPIPEWEGEPLEGKRIVLLAEQGFGDAIMMSRYIPMVAQRGGKVTLILPAELKRLFSTIDRIDTLLTESDLNAPVNADFQCSLTSLPRIFGTRVDSVPAPFPILRPDPALVERWRGRINGEGRKIGLIWAGRPEHPNDRNRSIHLSALAALSQLRHTRFVSLQLGSAAAETPPPELELIDLTSEIHDFADSAAIIESLDLVIAVDTAITHLAGALNKPTYVLLPKIPDWRWMLDREDSPWYPSMRLSRQSTRGDWSEPLARLIAALQ